MIKVKTNSTVWQNTKNETADCWIDSCEKKSKVVVTVAVQCVYAAHVYVDAASCDVWQRAARHQNNE